MTIEMGKFLSKEMEASFFLLSFKDNSELGCLTLNLKRVHIDLIVGLSELSPS